MASKNIVLSERSWMLVSDWVFVLFFYAKFLFPLMFSVCIPPHLNRLLSIYFKSCALNTWLVLFAKMSIFISQRASSGYIIVLIFTSQCVYIYSVIWEWFKPEWCLFCRERFAATKFLNFWNDISYQWIRSLQLPFILSTDIYTPFKIQQNIN